jgi:hypothetical protein
MSPSSGSSAVGIQSPCRAWRSWSSSSSPSQRATELSHTNEQLLREIEERRRAEAGRQRMQDELVQASKLAVLGQIA